MTEQELKERYTMLYDYMSASKNPSYMMVFGKVMTEMMNWMIFNEQEAAEKWIEKLDSIRWKNYLTPKEAESIISNMEPSARWSRDTWKRVMESLGLPMEETPCYNSCSLWVEMNKVYSDSAASIAKIMGVPVGSVKEEDMVRATHALATDNLKDEDDVYSIRHYFRLDE
jgi:hypothetical protein